MERRGRRERQLLAIIDSIAQEHGLTYTLREDTNSEARFCADWIKDVMKEQAGEMGLAPAAADERPFSRLVDDVIFL